MQADAFANLKILVLTRSPKNLIGSLCLNSQNKLIHVILEQKETGDNKHY